MLISELSGKMVFSGKNASKNAYADAEMPQEITSDNLLTETGYRKQEIGIYTQTKLVQENPLNQILKNPTAKNC